ncbi:MAG TPA: hypothetical protein VGK68_09520 [Gaiellaceae bacterium]
MPKRLIVAFLLVLVAVVLGSTVFREQVVDAATTPFQQVVVQNTSTNPVPVTQVGTSTTSVSGTVGIDPSKNSVKLDSSGNTVNLDSTDSGHLTNIENDLGNLKFDGSGNLETTAQVASPAAVTEHCTNGGSSGWDITTGSEDFPLCSSQDFYVTDVTGSGMDDNLAVDFIDNGNTVLELLGSGVNGADSYQLDLTHPIHVDEIDVSCNNASSDCKFSLAVLGNSTGN